MIRVPVHRKLAAPAAIIFAAAVTAVSAQGVAACASAGLPWSVNAVAQLGGQNARIFIAQTDVHHISRLARGTIRTRVVPFAPNASVAPAAPTLPRFDYASACACSTHQHAAP
jgi:hypothetical protein